LSVQRDVGVALAQLGNLFARRRQTFAGAIDADVCFHGVHHFLTQSRDGLRAVALVEQGLDAVLRLFRLGGERRVAAGGRSDCRWAMALSAARRPNTSSSVSELEPSRLAPLMLTQAHSPAANSPGSRVAACTSVWMPPIM
jgi:hypothetical protein